MSTFRHEPTGKRYLFVHIPRTGGRYVENNLLQLNDMWWDDDREALGKASDRGEYLDVMYKAVEGVEVGHFHKELYEKYLDCKGIPHFSIVRNPVTRFISASLYLRRFYESTSDTGPIQELMEDEITFNTLLENIVGMVPEARNWYRPQVDFMTEETHIWKFEDGLGDQFVSWLSGIIEVDLKFDENVQYATDPDEHIKLELTEKLLHNLVRFYKQDLDAFYPNHEYTKLAASLQEGAEAKTQTTSTP